MFAGPSYSVLFGALLFVGASASSPPQIVPDLESVSDNLAMGKLSFISSIFKNDTTYRASRANDGYRSSHFSQCAHTARESNPWWTVDLGKLYNVRHIQIFRSDFLPCPLCASRLEGFEIYLSDESAIETPGLRLQRLCFRSEPTASVPQVSDVYCAQPTCGRYLTITLNRTGIITLCEVQVFGDLHIGDNRRCEPTVTDISTSFDFTTTDYKDLSTEELSGCKTELVIFQKAITDDVQTSSQQTYPSLPVTSTKQLTATNAFQSEQTIDITHSKDTSSKEATDVPDLSSFHSTLTQSNKYATPPDSVTSAIMDMLSVDTSRQNDTCYCEDPFCSLISPVALDPEMFLSSIIDDLHIDTKNVSKERRRYTSAPDKRPSAKRIGSVGVVFIAIVFGSIILNDVVSFVNYLITHHRHRCRKAKVNAKQ